MRAAFALGERQRLVHGVRVQALRAAEHRGERLDRGAHDVDLGLLGGERHTSGLGVEAERATALVGGAVAPAHPARPDASGGSVLRDLLEEVDVGVEEERQAGRELVDRQARASGELHVREAVRERERQLLERSRTGLADVVAGDRDRVPAGHLGRAERDGVAHQAHRLARGNTNSFWAWYSFRMSFCSVPPSLALGTPCASALATNIASSTAAGALIVIDVVIPPRSMSR